MTRSAWNLDTTTDADWRTRAARSPDTAESTLRRLLIWLDESQPLTQPSTEETR